MRKVFLLVVTGMMLWNAGTGPVNALPLGEREAAHFGREVVRTLKEVLKHPADAQGDTQHIRLNGMTIRETPIQAAEVVLHGVSQTQMEKLLGDVNLDSLQAGKGISVQARLTAKAINALIMREIGRLKPEKRIFDRISVFFQNGQVQVSGLVDFRKIPGNLLAFLSRDFSPFTAVVKVTKEGSQIHLDIVEAMVNEQPMTPELRTQILAWLNPAWDFAILPYPAELEGFEITPEGISFHGTLFTR